jgi:hypothetical protein
MFKFLRKTALWVLALPLLITFLGIASNQLVLKMNHDQFPVMWSDYKVAQYEAHLEKEAQSDDVDGARQAQFDLMELESEGFIDDTHVVMTSKTHLNLLADIIDFHTATYSVGDMSIELGDYLWSYAPLVWGLVIIGKLKDQKE